MLQVEKKWKITWELGSYKGLVGMVANVLVLDSLRSVLTVYLGPFCEALGCASCPKSVAFSNFFPVCFPVIHSLYSSPIHRIEP